MNIKENIKSFFTSTHSLDSSETVNRLLEEASNPQKSKAEIEQIQEENRAATLQNRRRLEDATGSTDVIIQSRRAQVIYSITELKRMLGKLHYHEDEEFADKIFKDIESLQEEKIFLPE